MNPIHKLQQTYTSFKTALMESGSSETQEKNLRLFSKTLDELAKSAPHLPTMPIQKRWNKICLEFVENSGLKTGPASKIGKLLIKIDSLLNLETAAGPRQKTSAVLMSELLSDSRAMHALCNIQNTQAKLDSGEVRSLIDSVKMLERVMSGVYGEAFKQKILSKQKNHFQRPYELLRCTFVDLVLRGKNPYKSGNWFDGLDVYELDKKYNHLANRLRKTSGLSEENIREILMKHSLIFQCVAQVVVPDPYKKEHWEYLRPYIDPTQSEIFEVAKCEATHHPEKAFQLILSSTAPTEERLEQILTVVQLIANDQYDRAESLVESIKEIDPTLYKKCLRPLAQSKLVNKFEIQASLELVGQMQDEEELVKFAPQFGKAIAKLASQTCVLRMRKLLHLAKTVEAQEELSEHLFSALMENLATHLESIEMYIKELTDPYLKNLCRSSLIFLCLLKASHTQDPLVAQMILQYEQIDDREIRMDLLERLAKPKQTSEPGWFKSIAHSFAMLIKDTTERDDFLYQLAARFKDEKSVLSITNHRTQLLANRFISDQKARIEEGNTR